MRHKNTYGHMLTNYPSVHLSSTFVRVDARMRQSSIDRSDTIASVHKGETTLCMKSISWL